MNGHGARLAGFALIVKDLRQTIDFYWKALGFTVDEASQAGPAFRDLAPVGTASVRLGAQVIHLAEAPVSPYPAGSTAADLWFQHFAIVTDDMDTAYRRIVAEGAHPITRGGPQLLPPSSGAVTAFKFRDLDGHPLELIQFPEGVGDPQWRQGSSPPTLGIDHSAISVGDVDRSLAFYRRLGLVLMVRQTNKGSEQNRLDGLVDAVVEVIGLAPPGAPTPHVELLCYGSPRGRAWEPGPAINDTRLIFQVSGLAGLIGDLGRAGAKTSGISVAADGVCAAIARDPDGHAVVMLEKPS